MKFIFYLLLGYTSMKGLWQNSNAFS